MLLAELEVWHSRPVTPTRRVALGHLVLPADPPPGFGGLLLGAVVAAHLDGVDEDIIPDLHRLIDQVDRGERVVQPRLRHRYQVDRHGLAHSTHRLIGEGEDLSFEFRNNGTAIQQVLGAVYATERLEQRSRHAVTAILYKAMRWRGPIGPALISHFVGSRAASFSTLADPRAWALGVLGFPPGTVAPSKKEVVAAFRNRLREVHPDHGASHAAASAAIGDLAEARRLLTEK